MARIALDLASRWRSGRGRRCKLTVVLFALAILLIFIGTLAQVTMDMWEVISLYFRSWLSWIDVTVLFPASWFPQLPEQAMRTILRYGLLGPAAGGGHPLLHLAERGLGVANRPGGRGGSGSGSGRADGRQGRLLVSGRSHDRHAVGREPAGGASGAFQGPGAAACGWLAGLAGIAVGRSRLGW